MKKFLRKNYSWIIPTIVTVVLSAISIHQTYYYGRKSLTYDIIDAKWLTKVSQKTNKIKVLYEDKVAKDDIIITTVKFINTGKAAIEKSDFEKPISIDFTNDSKILDVIIGDKKPDSIDIQYTFNNNKVVVSPLLLNSGDTFAFNVISDGINGKAHVNARIKGVSNIEFKTSIMQRDYKVIVWYVLNLIICNICLAMIFVRLDKLSTPGSKLVFDKIEVYFLNAVACIGSSVYFNRLIYLLKPEINYWQRPLIGLSIIVIICFIYHTIKQTKPTEDMAPESKNDQ